MNKPNQNLTIRESAVILAMCRGLTKDEIAAELDVSPHTVKFHVRRAYRKLGAKTGAHAAALFVSSIRTAS